MIQMAHVFSADWVLWVLIGFCWLTGVAGIWWLSREMNSATDALNKAPIRQADAQFAVPWAIRLLRTPLAWLSVRLSPFTSAISLEKTHRRLALAGFDGAIEPSAFIALKALGATTVLCLGIAWLLNVSLNVSLSDQSLSEIVSQTESRSTRVLLLSIFTLVVAAWWLPNVWLMEVIKKRQITLLKALPFFIDLLKISIESGSNIQGALQYAVSYGPAGPLRYEFSRVLSDIKGGRPRVEALQSMAKRLDSMAITHLVAAISSVERQGGSLVGILQSQAEQRRNERFSAAETAAMKAPVKLIFPLVAFIFPGTFIVLFFPVVVRIFQEGLLR